MAEAKDNVHRITREELLKHREQAEHRLVNVMHRGRLRRLPEEVRKLDKEDQFLLSREAADLIRSLRNALCVFEAVNDLLESRTGASVLLGANDTSKRSELERKLGFIVSFAAFALGAFMTERVSHLKKEITKSAPGRLGKVPEDFFDYGKDRNEALKVLLSDYLDALESKDSSGSEIVRDWQDLVHVSSDFFEALKAQSASLAQKDTELLSLVSGITFEVLDVRFTGTEMSKPFDRRLPSFTEVRPEEVVGNEEAKQKVLRYMDRLALYDVGARKNPVLELGGLAWTVFWDGLPGTGKTTMMRMAMTRLRQIAQIAGQTCQFVLIDPSIKDEYYGRTGKNLVERLNLAGDQAKLTLVFFDDIDLLLMPRGSTNISGSDLDILNITMQFLDGAFTVRVGNAQVYAATNEPMGTESALRQRFHDRLEIRGPETWKDFADLFHIKLRRQIEQGLVPIAPGKRYNPPELDKPWAAGKAADVPQVGRGRSGKTTWEDIGRFAVELRDKDKRFTGRPIHSISEELMDRCADFDIPGEFYEKPEVFLNQPYERKVQILKDLYRPITADMVLGLMEKYLESEQRYEAVRKKGLRERVLDEMIARYEAEVLLRERFGK